MKTKVLLMLHIFDNDLLKGFLSKTKKKPALVIFICIDTRCVQFVLKDSEILYLFKYLKCYF